MQTALSLKHYPNNLQDRLQSILAKMTPLDKKYKRLWCHVHPVTALRCKEI